MQPEFNPLDRARHELRANGDKQKASDQLRAGIHTRGYLPHVKREGTFYFVTFRLADSLPQDVILELKGRQAEKIRSLENDEPAAREMINREYQREIERHLDRGMGECFLRRPKIADMVAEALLYFQNDQYALDDWVIMPNHVHVILWPTPNHTLSAILRSRKRHTARQANLMLSRTGEKFWQEESYDHWIRDEAEKARIRRYIRNNPVKAGLCELPEEWPWSSANFVKGKPRGLAIRDTAD